MLYPALGNQSLIEKTLLRSVSGSSFVHDVLEHCERYHSLFVQFAIKGIEVQSFDLPGFGETGARADTQGITGE